MIPNNQLKKPISSHSVAQATPNSYRPKTSSIMAIKSRLSKLKMKAELLMDHSAEKATKNEESILNKCK